MATFKCEVRKHQQRADGTWNVKLRITHRRQSRWLPTTIYVTADDLTARGNRIRSVAVLDRCERLLREVRTSVARLSPFALEEMDVAELVAWVRKDLGTDGWRLDFFGWGDECMARMSEGARGNYRNALSALARFYGTRSRDINAISAADIRAFGDWLDDEPKQAGNGRADGTRTTRVRKARGGVSASYVRSLARLHTLARQRFNDPDAERQRIPRNPFEGYGTRPAPVRGGQRSLGVEGIQALIDAEREGDMPWAYRQGLALFLLSFCLMGANIADLYEAPPVTGDWWIYRRKKVRDRKGAAAEIRVRVPACARRYIGMLGDATGRRWLGLYLQDKNAMTATGKENKRLRAWQKASGWQGRPFTLGAARHSWGTIAHGRHVGVDRDKVDEALGHDGKLDLTDVYIEKDWEMLNGINGRVLSLFRWD